MKRTTFAWGLVGSLVLVSAAKADEPGVVVLDRIGPAAYTVRGQSDDHADDSADHSKAPAAPPSMEPEVEVDHGHETYGHNDHGHQCQGHDCYGHGMSMYDGMPMYGSMPMHGYGGDWTMSPGCSTGCMHGCCSDEGWKPTGNAILDAPVELTTALVKGIFCHCRSCCHRGHPGSYYGGGRQKEPKGRGCYQMNYPVNPWYFDQRDGQVYSAEGYGAPMAVPLAPCVRQSYNYSWGIPSSRITPLSRMPGQGGY